MNQIQEALLMAQTEARQLHRKIAERDRTIAALADALEEIGAWKCEKIILPPEPCPPCQARQALAEHAEVIQRSREAK